MRNPDFTDEQTFLRRRLLIEYTRVRPLRPGERSVCWLFLVAVLIPIVVAMISMSASQAFLGLGVGYFWRLPRSERDARRVVGMMFRDSLSAADLQFKKQALRSDRRIFQRLGPWFGIPLLGIVGGFAWFFERSFASAVYAVVTGGVFVGGFFVFTSAIRLRPAFHARCSHCKSKVSVRSGSCPGCQTSLDSVYRLEIPQRAGLDWRRARIAIGLWTCYLVASLITSQLVQPLH